MQSRTRFASLVVILVLLLVFPSGCAPSATPTPQPEITIGILTTLSGPYAEPEGQPLLNAARLAVAEVNAAGGLTVGAQTYTVTLVVADDGNNPETATAAAQQLINQEDIMALVGPVFSSNAIPVARAAEAAHIPMIAPVATNPEVTLDKTYVFRAGFTDDFQGRIIAVFAARSLQVRRAAVLYDISDDYTRTLAEVFKTAFEEAGGEIVAFEPYTPDIADFTDALGRIQAGNPEVLFLPNYPEDVAVQAPAARALGITATFLGGDAWDSADFAAMPDLNGAYYTTHWHRDSDNAPSQAFVAAYREAYGIDPVPTAALTYDSLGLIFAALRAQGGATSEAIRTGLAGTQDYQGISGTITFHNGGDPIKSAVVMQVREGQAAFYAVLNP